ncbi:hypothetical protein [Kocuria sabuli]|uniref:hypothetical protein n=1 Tax=Kocuria sabuli TaxID=3071448 RepID=UPI0034D71549
MVTHQMEEFFLRVYGTSSLEEPARPEAAGGGGLMGRHHPSTVLVFEFTRTVRKRGFWIATLAIPVVNAIVFALSFASNTSISDSSEAQAEAELSFPDTDAYFAYPPDPAAEPIEVTGADRGLFDNGAYAAVAESLLTTAAQQEIGDLAAAGDLQVESTTYRGSEVSGGFGEAIAPLGCWWRSGRSCPPPRTAEWSSGR